MIHFSHPSWPRSVKVILEETVSPAGEGRGVCNATMTTLSHPPFISLLLFASFPLAFVLLCKENIPFNPKTNSDPLQVPLSHMSSAVFLMGQSRVLDGEGSIFQRLNEDK